MSMICDTPAPGANRLRVARERDALRTRVLILEAALGCIEREVERALAEPQIAFLVSRRIAAVARQVVPNAAAEVRRGRINPE